ncbi:endonuclease/exonuclease/phosphatase family protein [Planctomycetota bacterium]
MKKTYFTTGLIISCIFLPLVGSAQTISPNDSQPITTQSFIGSDPIAKYEFDENIDNTADTPIKGSIGGKIAFGRGLEGQALRLKPGDTLAFLKFDSQNLPFNRTKDFSVQFWIKTTMDSKKPFVILSQKEYIDNSLASQKKAGWVLYSYGGTWAWTIGSDGRRVTHENENGQHMPLNDGKWHQLTMTYNSAESVVRLFYDGDNKALYKVSDISTRNSDTVGFDFTSTYPLIVGWNGDKGVDTQKPIHPAIGEGTKLLQDLVDAFNAFGLEELKTNELLDLISSSERLFNRKVEEKAAKLSEADRAVFRESMKSADLESIKPLVSRLMSNPYTVNQSRSFMEVAPLLKLYSLVGSKVVTNPRAAKAYSAETRLYAPDFDIDNLVVWDRALLPEEVMNSYTKYFKSTVPEIKQKLTSITAGVWNIEHGGKHFTIEDDGWDSRIAIAQMLKKEGADVIMMQETYSSGDFIAAELGYYFASSVDWDYLNQGANLSVISRYPIKELCVSETSPFQNVGTRVAISKTQDMYVMSNWYGMDQFTNVFNFHKARFETTDNIPILFAGDFNAVSHTDGGNSPASRALLDAGFTDAFRNLYPDVQKYPGASHRGGRRIDQLYYKGKGLKNTSMKVVSTWSPGFPSDHYLLIGKFDLNYSTVDRKER